MTRIIFTCQRSKRKKNTSKKFSQIRDEHQRFLASKGIEPLKRKSLRGSTDNWSDLSVPRTTANTSDTIPDNGTKSPDMSKARFAQENFALVPAYNKGPIQPVSRDDLKMGAGRKL